MADIPGGQTVTAQWLVRGDEEGSWGLSATYTGTLQPVGLPVQLNAALVDPIHVWGLSAINIEVTADQSSLLRNPYAVTIAIRNVTNSDPSDEIPLFNVGLQLLTDTTINFSYQPNQQLEADTAVLEPGDALTIHATLLPDFTGDLRTDLSFVEKKAGGQTSIDTGAIINSQPVQGGRLTLTGYGTATGVGLDWQPVSGATGYQIWSTTAWPNPIPPNPNLHLDHFTGSPLMTVGAVTHADVTAATGGAAEYAVVPLFNGTPGTIQNEIVQVTGGSGSQTPATLSISAPSSTITAGTQKAYTVSAQNGQGASLGDVTTATTFTITPDGTCTASSCTAAIPGAHTIRASYEGVTTTATLTVTAGAALAGISDVIGVGDRISQYALDFNADGDDAGDPGVNSNALSRLVSIDATADFNGRTAYSQGSTSTARSPLDPTVVLQPGVSAVQRPDSSSAGIAALLADTQTPQAINFVRSSRLPTAAEQAAAGANGWGGLHVITYATDATAIAVAATTNAPAGLSPAELVNIYDGTYQTWGDVPGYTGSAPNDQIIALLPAPGTDARALFDADLAAANLGIPVAYSASDVVVGDDDYSAIESATDPADAIEPFSAAQLSLIEAGYFGSDVEAAIARLAGTAPDGAASYAASHPLYIIVRDSDIASTAHWNGSSANWANRLFTGSRPTIASGAGQTLLANAGLTAVYTNLGDVSAG